MVDHNLVALLLVASFVCAVLMFWLAVRAVSTGVARYRDAFTENAKINLERMFLFIDATQLLTLNALVVVVLGVGMWLLTGSWIFTLLAAASAGLLPKLLMSLFLRRRAAEMRKQLPDAVMLMAGALRAGASVPTAIAQMAAEIRPPLSQEFDLFLREQRLGVSFEQALDNLEARVGLEDMTLFGSAMRVSRETGGNLAETLERLAETLRTKLTIEGKIRALTAQGKLQGIIVALLPFGLMFVLMKMEPVAMSKLFSTWYGLAVIGFIVVMELVGGLIIKKIVTIDI